MLDQVNNPAAARPMAGGVVAVTLWGLAPVATRAAVAHLAPLPLLVLRLTLAALVLLPWALPVFRRLRPRAAGRLLAAGALGLIGYNLPVTVGLQWLPASTAGLLLATEPVWVMALGYAFLGERGGARAWLGSAVALGGVLALGTTCHDVPLYCAVKVAELLLRLVTEPTAHRLAGEMAVTAAKPSLPDGLGLATICHDAAYAGVTLVTTGTTMAAATANARQ